jgi:glycosyltransferase involved in cell wall biosynthesis
MKIGINALFLRPSVNGGIETYLRNLLPELVKDPSFEWYIFLPLDAADVDFQLPNLIKIVLPFSASTQLHKYFFEQIVLPWWIQKEGIDLVHSLAYVGPVFTGATSVVTVHDTNFLNGVCQMGILRRLGLGGFCWLSCLFAASVIAVSDYTRSQIASNLAIPRTRLRRIYEAPKARVDICEKTLTRFNLVGKRYFFAFGGRFPHKNINRLVLAHKKIREQSRTLLVVSGKVADSELERTGSVVNQTQEGIIVTQYCSDREVAALVNGALAYVHPSLHEGFGLPVIEAQAAGVPVLCSSATCLPEVAGVGAYYFDPNSVDEIAKALLTSAENSVLREELIDDGHRNVERFSWEDAGRLTIHEYRQALLCSAEMV